MAVDSTVEAGGAVAIELLLGQGGVGALAGRPEAVIAVEALPAPDTQHKAYMKASGLRELCSARAGCLAEHGAAQQCQRIGTTS